MKKNNQGFTLIELLAAITIMALILLMIVPALDRLQNNNKNKPFEYYGDSLVEAAKIYVNKESEDITNLGTNFWTGCVDISYQDLLNAGLIKPYSDEAYNCTSAKVRYSRGVNSAKYTYNLTCTKAGKKVFEKVNIPNQSCTQEDMCNRNKGQLLGLPVNDKTIKDYQADCADKTAMFVFEHTGGSQQNGWTKEQLTDYRYIGTSPNNYLTFNEELWRIIGVFTVEDENGTKQPLIKITRDESIGQFAWDAETELYSWSGVNFGQGINEWSNAKLMHLLNDGYQAERRNSSFYWSRKRGICYQSNYTVDASANSVGFVECNFSLSGTIKGLSETARSQIAKVKWYLGGSDKAASGENAYIFERSDAKVTSQHVTKTTSWLGQVALFYPSDYAYTFANGFNDTCFENMANCNTSNGGNPTTSWLYKNQNIWLLSPSSKNEYTLFRMNSNGIVDLYMDSDTASSLGTQNVYPTVYLKSSVTITGGDGTKNNPYTLS